MVDVIDALRYSTEIVGKLRALNKKVGEAEFQMFLADLTSSLGDAKLDAANLKIELAELKQQNGELRSELNRRTSAGPEIDDGAYVFGDNGRHYCTGCYDNRGAKTLLRQMDGPFRVFGKWECPVCKQTFGPSN